MYIVVNIGCIECGVSSNVVGSFEDYDKALSVACILSEKMYWRGGGQNEYQVFEVPPLNHIEHEYIEALEV